MKINHEETKNTKKEQKRSSILVSSWLNFSRNRNNGGVAKW